MKKNNIIYTILLTLIVLFSNSMDVKAEIDEGNTGSTSNLTCTYDNDTRFVQNPDNSFEIYKKSSGKWDLIDFVSSNKVTGKSFESEKVRMEFNSKYFNESTKRLTTCPMYSFNSGRIYQYFDEQGSGRAKFLPGDNFVTDKNNNTSSVSGSIKELTCVASGNDLNYNGNNAKNSCRLLKQLPNGEYEMYSALKNNGSCDNVEWTIVDISSSYIGEKLRLNSETRNYLDSNGYLNKCPVAMNLVYDYVIEKDGYVFFDDDDNSGSMMFDFSEYVPKNSDDVINGNNGVVVEKKSFIGKTCKQIFSGSSGGWLSDLDNNYSGSCLYGADKNNVCTIVQLDYSKTGAKASVYSSKFNNDNLKNTALALPTISQINNNRGYLPIISKNLLASSLEKSTSGECPEMVYVSGNYTTCANNYCTTANYEPFNITMDNPSKNGDVLLWKASRGNNFLTGDKLNDIDLSNIGFSEVKLTCEDLFGDNERLVDLIKGLYKFVKIFIPLVLIVLSSLDFAKSVFASSEDEMKKTTKKFTTRIIIAVAIFLIPSVLELLLGIAFDIWGILSPDFCGILS